MRDGAGTRESGFDIKRSIKAMLLGSAAICLAAALAGETARPAQAQAATAQAAPFDIRAQDLGGALASFADRAGLRLLFASDLVAGRASPGISGSFTPEDALDRLLAGTGLTYRFTDASTVTILDPNAITDDGALVLDTIDVQGTTDSVFGGEGYVATQATAGTKTDTPLIKTPQTINVVKKEQMEAQAVSSIAAALRYTPGIRTELYGPETGIDSVFKIRGFQSQSDSFYFNGLKQQFSSSTDPYLLEGIEIVKGPASVLYGQASPGGLVNIVSKLPSETPIREISILAGYPAQARLGFDFGGPIDQTGHFLYRVTGIGWDKTSDIDFAKGQRIAIAPSLTWKPNEDTNFTIYGIYQHDPEIIRASALPALGTVWPNPNGPISRSRYSGEPNFDHTENTIAKLGYSLEYRFSDYALLRSTSTYNRNEYNNKFVMPLCSPASPDFTTVCRWASNQQFDADIFATDNRLQFDFDTNSFNHKLITGFDYQYQDRQTATGSATPSNLDLYNPIYTGVPFTPQITSINNQRTTQIGLYVQDQIEIGRLNLLIGGRQDWATSRTRNEVTGVITNDKDDDAFTWRAGAIYNFNSGISPYASYSESFEPIAGVDYFEKPFKPTTGQQYEVGITNIPILSPTSSSGISDRRRGEVASDTLG